jgi:hypothetical protein
VEKEFRLLYLQPSRGYNGPIYCTLQYCSLASPPPYVALSYCWGERSGSRQVWLNGTSFKITRSLYRALRQLRSHGYTTFWIDALCIDQDDLEERSLQVNRMQAIYRKATMVAVWLGRDANGSDNVMRSLAAPNGPQIVSLPQLQCFLERSYWQRTWIVQEIVSATRLAVFCGAHILDWGLLDHQLENLKELNDLDAYQLQFLSTLCELRKARFNRQPIHFLELFRRTRNLSATDRRDKIFAILGLSFDGSDFVPEPNYRLDEHELCLSVTTTAIEVQASLDLILLAPRKPEDSNLPSWCPDYMSVDTHPFPVGIIEYLHGKSIKWRVGTQSTRWEATAQSRLTSRNFRIQDGVLEVYGLFIGRIVGLSAPADCLEPGNEMCAIRAAGGSDMATLHALSRVFKIYDPQYRTHALAKDIFPYLWAALEPLGKVYFDRCMEEHYEYYGHDEYYARNCKKIMRWFQLNSNFTIQGKTLREWAFLTGEAAPARKFKGYIRQAPMCDDDPDRLAMVDILDEGLRLITTNGDNLGWAHPESRPGDWVCLLAGCSTPVVLRSDRSDHTFRLIGHAYVDGFMDGLHWQKSNQDNRSLAKIRLE